MLDHHLKILDIIVRKLMKGLGIGFLSILTAFNSIFFWNAIYDGPLAIFTGEFTSIVLETKEPIISRPRSSRIPDPYSSKIKSHSGLLCTIVGYL